MKLLRLYKHVEIEGVTTSSFAIGAHEVGGVTEAIEVVPGGVEVVQRNGGKSRRLLVMTMGVVIGEWAEDLPKPKDLMLQEQTIAKRKPGRPRKHA